MPNMPPNCPLTQEEFDSLPIEVQTSKTGVWIKDADNMDDETLDALVANLNHAALPAIAHLYFAQSTHTQLPQQPTTISANVRIGATNGR